jgi:hypothetical protein
MFLSDNHGASWKKIYDGSVENIISDDLVPRTIYFTTQYGIMKFLDTLTVTGIDDDDFLTSRPDKYFLEQNYPNPFNPSTQINYYLKEDGFVTLKIFDILGREVENLVNEFKSSGNYTINFNAGNLSSGVYFYNFRVNDFTEVKKMLLKK